MGFTIPHSYFLLGCRFWIGKVDRRWRLIHPVKTCWNIWRWRLGSEFFEEFFIEEEKILSLILPTTSYSLQQLSRESVWYLDIIRINDLVNHLAL